MIVYIAGKITEDLNYREKFSAAAEKLQAYGDVVLNPATLPDGLAQRDYMRICLAMIDAADMVLFLPDWAESEGAMLEQAYCRRTWKNYDTFESYSARYV